MTDRVKKIIHKPSLLLMTLGHRGLLNWMSDRRYLEIAFKIKMGKKLNLDDPQTFNEKLQWLKLYNRKPIYTQMVDKVEAKKYAAERIGDQYIIPTLGVWNHFDEIDFDKLPEQFVLKCTHNSGGLVIVKSKQDLDRSAARSKIERGLKYNFYYSSREWPYKDVPPRIIAEQYMEDENSFDSLNVYKIFCFSGTPYLIQTIQNDKTQYESIDYFDTSWNILELRQNFPNSKVPLKKPVTLEKMLTMAGTLSQGHPFIRTDFYEVNGNVYFSEFTFFTDAGFEPFHPDAWDERLGKMLKITM